MRNNGFSADKIIIDILVFCISYGFVDCPVLITVHDCMGSHRSCLVIIKITMDSSVTRQSFHAFSKATDGVQYNIITWLLYANHIVTSLFQSLVRKKVHKPLEDAASVLHSNLL